MNTPHFLPKRYTAGKDVVSASDLNARGEEIKRLARLSISPPGQILSTATGMQIILPPGISFITARITAVSGEDHSWVETYQKTDGTWADVTNGASGDAEVVPMVNPARALNGDTAAVDDPVQLWPGNASVQSGRMVQRYWFIQGGSSNPAPDELLYGRIDGTATADTPPAHGWTEMQPIGEGDYEEKPGGIVGDVTVTPYENPAYETKGGTATDGDIVWVRRGAGPYVEDGWMIFDGEDNDDNSQGVWASAADTGVSTAPVTIELTIKRDRTGVVEVLCGKWGDTGPTWNYVLVIDGNVFKFHVMNSSGVVVSAVGTTSLAADTEYALKAEWDGSVIKVYVDDVQEGTTPAVAALQAPDATTKFYIARDAETTAGGAPFPFKGVMKNVKVVEDGTTIVDFPLSSISGNTTDDIGPQELVGKVVGIDWRFLLLGGGGGSVVDLVKILAIPASGSAVVAGKIRTVTDDSPLTITDGADCWVFEQNSKGTFLTTTRNYQGLKVFEISGVPLYAVQVEAQCSEVSGLVS